MQSKTFYSKAGLFRACLRRYWPLPLVVLAVLLFWIVFPMASLLASVQHSEHLANPALTNLVRDTALSNVTWMPLYTGLFALGTAMVVFEHAYSTRLTGLFASLPARRDAVFSGHWLAGLVMLLVPGVLTALALLAAEAVYGAADLMSAASWLGVYALECVTFYGIAVFCVMLTGHMLVIPALYLLVNFAASALTILLSGLVESYSYGVSHAIGSFSWMHTFSPFVRLVTTVSPQATNEGLVTGLEGWGWAIAYCAVGLALSALALLLYLRRHNERVQETTAFGVLRPILKYIVTAFFALGLPFLVLYFLGGFSFYGDNVQGTRFFAAHLALTVLGALIGYFLSEMIIHKSLRVFSRGWLRALLAGALCCGVVCLFRFDAFGIARHVPAADEVAQVDLYVGSDTYSLKTPEGVEAIETLHREFIARQSETEQLLETANAATYFNLVYVMRDGSTLHRGYPVPGGALLDLTEETLNSPAVLAGVKELNPPVPVDAEHLDDAVVEIFYADGDGAGMPLTTADALSLYNEGILPDIAEGHYGKANLHYDENAYRDTHYNVFIYLSLKNDHSMGSNTLVYELTTETAHTNAWLTARGVTLKTIAEQEG